MPRCLENRRRVARRCEAAQNSLRALACLILAIVAVGSPPARAQVSGSVSVTSDDRLRGRTLSSGRPAASLALSYDDASGFYIDGAATAASTRADGIALIGATVDIGYARRMANGMTIDIGALRQQFTRHFSGGRVTGYTELYAGVGLTDLSIRLSYSPDYFAANSHALYLSVDRAIRLSTNWRIAVHGGAIAYLSPLRVRGLRTIEYDYGASIARRWGRFEGQLGLSSGGPDPDYYRGERHGKTRVVVGGSVTF